MQKLYYSLSLLLLLICSNNSALGYQKSLSNQNINNKRHLFQLIEADLKRGNSNLFKKHQTEMQHYPLYPYLEYIYLQRNLDLLSTNQFKRFTSKYPDLPLIKNFTQNFLLLKAKQQKWDEFLHLYKNSTLPELKCHALYANWTIHHKLDTDNLSTVWLTGSSLPRSCDKIIQVWDKQVGIPENLIWQRIKLAITDKNYNVARHLTSYLDNQEKYLVDLWIKVNETPKIIKLPYYFHNKHPVLLEIIVHGLTKIAKKDPKEAIEIWQNIADHHAFNERHWILVVRSIGLSLAKHNHANCDKWLKKIPKKYATPEVYGARLRYYIANASWHNIISLFDELTPAEQIEEKWLYWYSKALAKTGDLKKSQAVLDNIAKNRSYYGFMASTRLLKPFSLKHKSSNIKPDELARVSAAGGAKRAYEFYNINRNNKANIEWRHFIKNISESERQAAAKLASQWNVPDWTIYALSKVSDKDDLIMRFPKNYENHILREANQTSLDPAWIFAVTRQESAFDPIATSSAGALGLMQLMPRTAKMVASSHNIKLKHRHELFDVNTNIKLGSRYLKQMLNKHQNNIILATAAYNAGPGRIQQWLPLNDMEADSWIELIPFRETYNYVQNVITYYIIYQNLLNGKNVFKRMPIIYGQLSLQ